MIRPGGRARLGVSLMFLTNGVLFSTLLPRYPEIKDTFGLSATSFGFTAAATLFGSVFASAIPAPLIRRFGARRVAAASSLAIAALVFIAGIAPAHWLLVAALFLAGFCDSVTDAAQNVQGVRVQRYLGKTIINSLHATWSAGATLGGLIGAGFAALAVPLGVHLGITGAVCAATVVWAAHAAYVPEAPPTEAAGGSTRVGGAAVRALAPLVIISIAGMMFEDAAGNWAALYLRDGYAAPIGLAGLGFAFFIAAQFAGRLSGDALTDRFGRVPVARAGSLLVAAGFGVATLAPNPWLVLAGFAATGFGCATLIPAAFVASSEIPGVSESTGITILGWLMRLSLLSSPTIGIVADATSLRTALLVPFAAAVLATALSGRLRPGHRDRT
ncbi:MAG: MFS transporter [Propionibacteriaceae bacterium]|nr:MFS transporter [Propionibacteriaceae bacterium]